MLVGVFVPLLLLLFFEFFPTGSRKAIQPVDTTGVRISAVSENRYAIRILGYAVFLTGILIILLGLGASAVRSWVISVGVIITVLGTLLFGNARNSN